MKKHIVSLSIASAIAFAGAMPAYAQDDVCNGVEVQTRYALANCLVESAVAIAAAAASKNGCAQGMWDIDAHVPEFYLATIPIQGVAYVAGVTSPGSYELNGSSSAMLKNNINCQISTTASGNTFDGKELNYSSGAGNYYLDAIIDRDSSTICISTSVSSGDIALGDDDMDEDNTLIFVEGDGGTITASGPLSISESAGQGANAKADLLSGWLMNLTAVIPPLGSTLDNAFQLTASTDDLDSVDTCTVKVDADVSNLVSWIIEGVAGGLIIDGTITVGP